MKRSKHLVWLAALAVSVVAAWRGDGAEPARDAGTVATIGSLKITRSELAQRERAALEDYRRRTGAEVPPDLRPSLRRQALEMLIRSRLLVLEAGRRGVTVPDAEVEQALKEDPAFRTDGVFSQRAFDNARQNSPEAFREAMARMRAELAGRKLNERLQNSVLPEESRLRAAAERELTRTSFDYLALRYSAFTGENEPSEREILDHYRSHPGEFRRPARAVLRVVSAPAGAEGRSQAEAAIAAVQSGTAFREAAEALGVVRDGIVVQPGSLPGHWRATPAIESALFRQPAGTVFPEPVPTADGWLVVWVAESAPDRIAPLREVAAGIREDLRSAARRLEEERGAAALYAQVRDSLARPAFRVRYAVVDTARVDPGRATAELLDRWYRSHQAEYTRYDAARGAIEVTPFEQVRDDVERRWRTERRLTLGRALAERIERAWRAGSRDRAAENAAGGVREAGPVAAGSAPDGTPAGAAIGRALAGQPPAAGTGITPFAGGVIVYQVHGLTERRVPAFEEVRDEVTALWRERRQQEEQRSARRLFEEEPEKYVTGQVVYFSRLVVEQPDVLDVPLTRAEVESWHREHFDRYSAAEQVRARHLLVSPRDGSPESLREAKRKAEGLLDRIRAGEDFAELARRHSDDDGTREQGGDLGFFARGVLLDPLDRAAFSLPVGSVSDLIHTDQGYHLLRIIDHLPLLAEPLEHLYANVGYDAAISKAERIARRRADSLFALVRTPEEARRRAGVPGFSIDQSRHMVGDRRYSADRLPMALKLEQMKPGEMYPNVELVRGRGAAILWVDSIGAPRRDWEQSAMIVLQNYHRMASQRTLERKRSEIDSLLAAGWSFDSVGVLWGGLAGDTAYARGRGIRDFGSPAVVDSIVLGTESTPPQPAGEPSPWIELPNALVRIRIRERELPSPLRVRSRMEGDRRLLLEYHLLDEFKAMQQRFPVRILDAELREVPLPKLPPRPVL